ncbi:hypothetical protein AB9P05_09845 [Roseivirga sp. BDSF3-8]|uniref:hypothetical protein n=1 Tax=Roseivirga sp. BDSF3-8 TaxID=3241598 RepID=UPI0035325702
MKNLVIPIFLFALISLCTTDATAQVGGNFPFLEGETLEDAIVSLPEDTKGKYTLVGLAYSKRSEDELNSWLVPVYDKFLRSSEEAGLFASFTYDVNVYFVPMFTGVKKVAAGRAKKKAIENIDSRLHQYILFYKGDIKSYKDQLDLGRKDRPYFFVLDENGKVVYATEGGYSDKKMEEITDILDEAEE